jgi:hypothetical protein
MLPGLNLNSGAQVTLFPHLLSIWGWCVPPCPAILIAHFRHMILLNFRSNPVGVNNYYPSHFIQKEN